MVMFTGGIGVHLLLSTCMSVKSSNKEHPYLWSSSGGMGSVSSRSINLDKVLAGVLNTFYEFEFDVVITLCDTQLFTLAFRVVFGGISSEVNGHFLMQS